jgi:DNA-binding CsgD family transcriptional regulator
MKWIKSNDLSSMKRLTPRERDVLGLLAHGRGDKEIALAMGITVGTVRTHTKSIFRKIGVHNRVQATLWWLDNADEAHDAALPHVPAGSTDAISTQQSPMQYDGWRAG